jgi:threonine dehydrogenase-like Zn-dependent dehydrogenase
VVPGVAKFVRGDQVATLSTHAFAERDVVPARLAVRLPASLEGQPFPGEALACAMNAFLRTDVRRGQTAVVIGVGFLGGLLVALLAKAGARVIAISRRPYALDIARTLGAAVTIPLSEDGAIVSQVRELTDGDGADRVIEAVGQQQTLDLAGEVTRVRGKLVIAGYHQDGRRTVDLQLWNWRGLDVVNAHERDPAVYLRGMRLAIAAIRDGQLDPYPLYTHCYGLGGLGQAMEAMRTRPDGFMKGLVMP